MQAPPAGRPNKNKDFKHFTFSCARLSQAPVSPVQAKTAKKKCTQIKNRYRLVVRTRVNYHLPELHAPAPQDARPQSERGVRDDVPGVQDVTGAQQLNACGSAEGAHFSQWPPSLGGATPVFPVRAPPASPSPDDAAPVYPVRAPSSLPLLQSSGAFDGLRGHAGPTQGNADGTATTRCPRLAS